MIRIDSLKAEINSNFISFNPEKYNKTENEINGIKSKIYHLNNRHKKLGLKNITVYESKTVIEMSSKYLPNEYFEMINKNNAAAYFDKLKKGKVIEFNTNDLLENLEIRTCDVTQNLLIKNSVKNYINAFSLFKFNDKYFCKIYEDESVTFLRKVTTNSLKENIIIYNKYPELIRKENSILRNELDIECFKNILRFETKLTTFKAIRNNLNINDNKLLSILNSDSKIHHKIFSRITDIPNTEIERFKELNNIFIMKDYYSRSEIRNILGDLALIQALNYDIDLIKLWINKNAKGNNSKTIKHYRELITSISNEKNKYDIDSKVDEIKEMLLVA